MFVFLRFTALKLSEYLTFLPDDRTQNFNVSTISCVDSFLLMHESTTKIIKKTKKQKPLPVSGTRGSKKRKHRYDNNVIRSTPASITVYTQ